MILKSDLAHLVSERVKLTSDTLLEVGIHRRIDRAHFDGRFEPTLGLSNFFVLANSPFTVIEWRRNGANLKQA